MGNEEERHVHLNRELLAATAKAEASSVKSQFLATMRILLAEDCPMNQQVALALLEKLGYGASAVANGQEVIAALEMFPYSLVLMDMRMPEMDGLEAARAIRAGIHKVNPKVPIIAMTASALSEDRTRCLEAGMDDYIAKPVTLLDLGKILDQWLPGAPPVRQLPQVAAPPERASSPGAAVFDYPLLISRLDNNEELAQRVLTSFLQNIPPVLLELKDKIKQGNTDAAWPLAHRIKGTAAQLTGMTVSAVALQMEMAGKAHEGETLSTLLPELEKQFALLQVAVEQQQRAAKGWGGCPCCGTSPRPGQNVQEA
jgi:CheY-like chemotaxis protein